MTLRNVWVETAADGLIRADQIVAIDVHETPHVTGKTSHWLFDVVLDAPVGSGGRAGWDVRPLHRTLTQTNREPRDATTTLAGLLAQLDGADAAGVVSATVAGQSTEAERIEFRFAPFRLAGPPFDELEPGSGRRAVTAGPAAIEATGRDGNPSE